MAKSLSEIDAIASNPEPPTFENTIVEMERTGKELDRVFTYYGIWSSNMTLRSSARSRRAMTPKLSDYSSKINQNSALSPGSRPSTKATSTRRSVPTSSA
jgi:peptidyl-dipeptidase Dcp